MSKHDYEVAWEKRLRALGVSAERVDQAAAGDGLEGRTLYDIRFQLDADNGSGVLVIVKSRSASGKEVGFVGGSTFTEALLSVGKRLARESLKWREDKPWDGAQGA